MKIKYSIDDSMNHNDILISYHSKNKDIVKLLIKLLQVHLGELDVYDEYHNHYMISIISIYYIEIIDHKTFIYTKDNVYRHQKNLTYLKKILQKYNFFQINVRTLVNKSHIVKYCVSEECRRKICLDNQEILIVNRHYKSEADKMILMNKKR